jgi:hypothetical protein
MQNGMWGTRGEERAHPRISRGGKTQRLADLKFGHYMGGLLAATGLPLIDNRRILR